MSFVVDNKTFSKVVKPLCNEKGSGVSNEVALLEKDKMLRDHNEVAKELHSYFSSIINSLSIKKNKYAIQKKISSSEPIDKAIMEFQFHILLVSPTFYPSILLASNSFLFTNIETDDVDEEIRTLNSKKSGTQNDIPAKILKKCAS